MRRWVVFSIALVFFRLVLASGLEDTAPSEPLVMAKSVEVVEGRVNVTSANETANPDCVIDLDCGFSHYSELNCSGDFVARYYLNYSCVGAGALNARCVNTTSVEFLNWCNPASDEACVEGELYCQPRISCSDGILNCHDGSCEEEIDCGGPCEPCPSCYNNVQDCLGGKCERGIDCGGPCPSCEIACASDSDCGIDRYGSLYCGRDGSVYRDYYRYKCVRPGMYGSWCKPVKDMIIMEDYCGPLNRCVAGECWRQMGHQWDSINYYEGIGPGDVRYLCDGEGCFEKRVYYNETPKDLRLQEY